MPYYQYPAGDYRTYGYGQGDPGFLSSLWKGVKKIAPALIGGLVGGPVGAAIGGGIGGTRTPGILNLAQAPPPQHDLSLAVGPMRLRSRDFYPPIPRFSGAGITRAAQARGQAKMDASTGCCARGYHLAKDGSGRCVRNRRMNIANPKALRRSMRRVQGFEKLARRTISFTRRVKMKK